MATCRNKKELRDFLEKKVLQYNHPSFIRTDPVSVPHRFAKKQDIEIAALFTAIFSWGNRTTIMQKSNELMKIMDDAPFDFIKNHHPGDLKKLMEFKHRTFNATDLLYFIQFLRYHFQLSDSLESAFLPDILSPAEKKIHLLPSYKSQENEVVKNALSFFYTRFFSLRNVPPRTQKHIATPVKNSACKRLNMFLRWMVRRDKQGVDFGIWDNISPADLICPLDLHVARVARRFGLISRKQTDWNTAMELTLSLREMDPRDPVKFDFALFSLGAIEKY
jgi:uncharacterized protein (TIGR02757 family)